jgi:uncharacterized membrane protein (DUF106 family)
MEFDFILLFLDTIFLQEDGGIFGFMGDMKDGLGSDDPIVKGVEASLFAQVKLKRIMKETRAWQKERMAAMRAKDQAKTDQLNKKSSYMNKMSMEMMQMNMRPMMITFVPLILIFYLVLPELFSYTVALSPIPLNVIPGDFFTLTCTATQAADVEHVCFEKENALYLWAWYFLSSIAFSGIIMKLTKTTMGV